MEKFLANCTLEEFTEWLKQVTIGDSFNNIEDRKSFKTIVINKLSEDNDKEYSYYTISDRDSIQYLYNALQGTAKRGDLDDLVEITEKTKLFIYSYDEQLMNSNLHELKYLIEFLKSLKEE